MNASGMAIRMPVCSQMPDITVVYAPTITSSPWAMLMTPITP